MFTMPKNFGKDTKFEKRELSLPQIFIGYFDERIDALFTLFFLCVRLSAAACARIGRLAYPSRSSRFHDDSLGYLLYYSAIILYTGP
jgi:hypothetical protein